MYHNIRMDVFVIEWYNFAVQISNLLELIILVEKATFHNSKFIQSLTFYYRFFIHYFQHFIIILLFIE